METISTADAILMANDKAKVKKAENYRSLSSIIWEKFCEHKMAVAGLILIALFILVALAAPLISMITGVDPNSQNPLNRYVPPMSEVMASSSQREIMMSRFSEAHPEWAQKLSQEIVQKNLFPVVRPEDSLFDLMNLEYPEMLKASGELSSEGASDVKKMVQGLKTTHLLGTDELGRDVLMRLVYGARVSIGVGMLVAIASAFIGLIIGAIAGFYGGVIDNVLMRITDSLLSLPQMPILIVVSAISLEKFVEMVPMLGFFITESNQSIVKLIFVLVLFSWMQVARLVRAEVLSQKGREYILAAKTLGASDLRLIVTHLFPNVLAPLLVSVTLGVGSSIQAEAALSFLGLGIQQPTPSWGNMMFNALEIMLESPALVIIPGLLVLLVTISFNYLGDGLQDAVNPKSLGK